MKLRTLLPLAPALMLAACGGGEEQNVSQPQRPGSVIYSFPADGQAGVSPKTNLVLRFSHPITDQDIGGKIRLYSEDEEVAYAVQTIDGGRSLKLTPQSRLATGQSYTLEFTEPVVAEGNRQIATPNAKGDPQPGIQFATRGVFTETAALANTDQEFGIASQVPAADSPFGTMNFSTFRFQMTHPIHPDWRALGGSIELRDAEGVPVNTTTLIKGNRITVDPCTTPDPLDCGSKADVLDTNQSYTLKLSNLPSLTAPGQTFSQELTFTPRDTSPTVVLEQVAIDSGLASGGDEAQATRSILNGQIINGVTLNSVLQGQAGPSQQTGSLFAELAFAPSFGAEESLPLRIPKGSVLNSTSLDVFVGGIVPVADAATGELQTTGNIKVTMLSDATGYMSPNAYTDDINAPRQITLFMDVSMNTEEAQPNAALSQDLLGVELRGIALVRDGVLTIDAIGMVEPSLLGQEYTDSTIAFHLEAATDADSALDAEHLRELDGTAPTLVSWMPGPDNAIPATRQSMHRPGDPVILFFDEPLDPDSIANGVSLLEDGNPMAELKIRLDGTTLTINPEGGLKHGADYQIRINGLTDLAGNVATTANLAFQLEAIDTATPTAPQRSPLALTTYPGYPCETTAAQIDLEAGVHGRCWDAAPDGEAGDVLPLTSLPADRPITVVFSQSMDLDSIRVGETFVVEEVNSDKSAIGLVTGRLEKNFQRIRFYPDEAWKPGSYYRYTMISMPNGHCDQVICGANGQALQTDLLEDTQDVGGQPMSIYFQGAEPTTTVFTALRNLPIRDTNANFEIDCDSPGSENCLEPFNHIGDDEAGFQPSANAAKLLVDPEGETDARVGCKTNVEGDCPRKKFIYQTYALNTEVTGPAIDPETGREGVGVLLYPTILATTSADVYINMAIFQAHSLTGPQVLRMRYAKDDPNCDGSNCPRNSLIPGIIVEDGEGKTIFKTSADLFLDAPALEADVAVTHNLYSYPFTLKLEGEVTFFDDGRMQIEQRNTNIPRIDVDALAVGVIPLDIPLIIPEQGIYLNFISNPVKEIPVNQ